MSDLLKQLAEWEANARIKADAIVGGKSIRFIHSDELHNRILLLTQALRVALNQLDIIASATNGEMMSMTESSLQEYEARRRKEAQYAMKEIETLLGSSDP